MPGHRNVQTTLRHAGRISPRTANSAPGNGAARPADELPGQPSRSPSVNQTPKYVRIRRVTWTAVFRWRGSLAASRAGLRPDFRPPVLMGRTLRAVAAMAERSRRSAETRRRTSAGRPLPQFWILYDQRLIGATAEATTQRSSGKLRPAYSSIITACRSATGDYHENSRVAHDGMRTTGRHTYALPTVPRDCPILQQTEFERHRHGARPRPCSHS